MKSLNFKKLFGDVTKQVKKHSPAIMTGIGVAGLATTAYLTGKATYKAVRKTDEAELHKGEPLTKKEIVKEVWKDYIPAVVTGAISTACIIGANSTNSKRNAALATAYQATQVAFADYKDEVVAQLGEKKAKQITKSVVDKKIKENPAPSDSQVVVLADGDQLFYDYLSGRYFKSNVISIEKAVNTVNQKMLNENYVSLNDFWDEVGLEPLEFGVMHGWNIDDGMIDVEWSTHMTSDGRSAIVIGFSKDPKINYDMFG